MAEGNPEVPGAKADVPEGISADDPHAKNPSFAPGATVGEKYVVERLVGEGGLGVVVAAKHLQLDQTVAIKYLRPRALGNKSIGDRFLREARLSARMRSEHAVHVYDVGTLDGTPYMVMELLVGMDLGRQLQTGGPLTPERTIDYVLQACEALAEAHMAGIVHRDIKPDNLFIATTGGGKSVLKILDFGISKMSAKRASLIDARELTEAGDKFGTPVYMSPEQLMASAEIDARADVWAMGVVFFELLTGQMPFDGDSLPELCTAILNKPPRPLLQHRTGLPPELAAVVGRCLEKDPANRFQNVAELAQELAPFVQQVGQERIAHIVKIVEGGGETVRASTLPSLRPGAISNPRGLRDVSTLMEPVEQRDTTGGGVGTWSGLNAIPRVSQTFRLRRTRLAAFAAAGVLAVAVLVASLTSHRSPGSASGPAAAAPAAPSTPQLPAVVVAEPAAPVPPLVEAEPAPAPSGLAAAEETASSAAPAPATAPAAAAPRRAPRTAPAKGKGHG
ncbi:MAG: serine/threonine-protein kinase, partial [Polyangiaceae bacterium]